jgi:hypothetical protein
MGLLDCVLRPSGLTHGRPPYSFLPSLGDVVPMVPNLIRQQQHRFSQQQALITVPSLTMVSSLFTPQFVSISAMPQMYATQQQHATSPS